jgi:hypothetical protein
MEKETYQGIGRKRRRILVKLWKLSGTSLSLKAWANAALIGDLGHVWINAKRGL